MQNIPHSMKQKPQREANKPRFVVDVNTSLQSLRQKYGGFARFISSAQLTGKQDSKDSEIIKIANEKDYHIITLNTDDFKDAPQKYDWLKVGIICVNLKEGNYRDRFGSLLRELKRHENYYNKLIIMGNKIEKNSYKALRIL